MSIYLARAKFEIVLALRNRNTVMFTMFLPIFLLVIFGSVFSSTTITHTNVRFSQYMVAGLLASGIFYSAFQQLAIQIPDERTTGALKRLAGSPMPPSVYFFGKIAVVVFMYVFQVVFLLGIGHLAYDVVLPTSWFHWFTFVWVSLLGLLSSALLGIAISSRARDGKSASAMTTPIVLFFQFTSGVFFVYSQLPTWMQDISEVFPLKWMTQAMRSVFLPTSFAQAEVSHSFQLPESAAVLVAWTVVAAILSQRTFRWIDRRSR